jgi:Uma2 family endonuclease
MTAALPSRATPEQEGDPGRDGVDRFVHLRGVTWADYQRLLEIRGESSSPRFTYLEGVVEIMSPSREHESLKSILGRLVETYCQVRGVEFDGYGSWTLESKEAERGAEPDECYVFGDIREPAVPHLAIEVVWTSGRLDKLQVYRKLGVREVWIWRRGTLSAYALRDDSYEEILASEVLPGIDLPELARFVATSREGKAASQVMRAYRAALETR